MKEQIINFLNKEKYSRTVFPYMGIPSEESKYNLPDRVSPTAYLARIFDPIWREICSVVPEQFSQRIDFNQFSRETGQGLYELAGKFIQDENKLGEWHVLSVDRLHSVTVHPGTEPSVKIEFWFYNLQFELWCTRWDMSYRPPEFLDCDFKMNAYKHSFTGTGELHCDERISIENCYISYSGEAYFGKKLAKGDYCSEISEDKFQRRRGKLLEDWWPFMKKLDESFLLPAKLKLDRKIVLYK